MLFRSGRILWCLWRSWLARQIVALEAESSNLSRPVSYTHLDVYKRQAFDERLFQSLMDGGIRKAQHLAHEMCIRDRQDAVQESWLRLNRARPDTTDAEKLRHLLLVTVRHTACLLYTSGPPCRSMTRPRWKNSTMPSSSSGTTRKLSTNKNRGSKYSSPLISVSYTHLDVYKRQPLASRMKRAMLPAALRALVPPSRRSLPTSRC